MEWTLVGVAEIPKNHRLQQKCQVWNWTAGTRQIQQTETVDKNGPTSQRPKARWVKSIISLNVRTVELVPVWYTILHCIDPSIISYTAALYEMMDGTIPNNILVERRLVRSLDKKASYKTRKNRLCTKWWVGSTCFFTLINHLCSQLSNCFICYYICRGTCVLQSDQIGGLP